MSENLKKRRERLAQASAAEKDAAKAASGGRTKARGQKVSRKAKTDFTVQIATLLDAGLPILRSLRILEGQARPGPMKAVLAGLAEDVETGASLSEAMSKHPKVFDELYVNMVRAGEAGGALTIIFTRLAEFLERTDALVSKVRNALIYPTFIVIFATAILSLLMIVVVPKFEQAFSAFGAELPTITRVLIDTARWCKDHWYAFLLIPVVTWVSLLLIGRTPKGRRFLDGVKLRIPLFGGILRRGQVARFTRTLGTLSQSGVPLLDSLDIVGDAAGNVVVKEAVEAVRSAVREGEPMAGPMAETGLFDDIVVNMVDVGEETGELDRMLLRIADTYDRQVEARIGALMQILEPLLIVVMGGVVAFIVIALFMPLLAIQDAIAR